MPDVLLEVPIAAPSDRVYAQITELNSNRRVCWAVQQGAPEWAGSHVTWDLAPVDGGTRVRLGHNDYPSVEGCFASVNFIWVLVPEQSQGLPRNRSWAAGSAARLNCCAARTGLVAAAL
jgi:hypothetical protein